MAAHVDDLRVRQDQLDQAQVHEVPGRLVDEAGPAEPAHGAGPGEVVGPELGGRLARHLGELVGVGGRRALGGRASDPIGEGLDLLQLARALHRRVAGQDLVDQGRARARQADDEDRVWRVEAPSGALGEEGLREHRLRAPDEVGGAVRVVGAARPLERVGFQVVGEGLRVPAGVLVRLGEGEEQVGAFARRRQVPPRGARLDRRPLLGGEAVGLEVGQRPPGLAAARVERQAPAVGRDGLVDAAEGAKAVAVQQPAVRLVGEVLEQGGGDLGGRRRSRPARSGSRPSGCGSGCLPARGPARGRARPAPRPIARRATAGPRATPAPAMKPDARSSARRSAASASSKRWRRACASPSR